MSVNLTNTYGRTPLLFSAEFGNMDAKKTLIESGAAINNTNDGGLTSLTVAADCGKLEIVRYLTELGADIYICNAEHNSAALQYAAESGSVFMNKVLLNKG